MLIKVHIQPGAKKDEVVGMHGDAVKIRLKAPPVDGKANDALIKFLSEKLDIPKAGIQIKSGHTSRQKFIELDSNVLSCSYTQDNILALLIAKK